MLSFYLSQTPTYVAVFTYPMMKGCVIMFENKIINGYTYASRFIISWIRVGGTLGIRGEGHYDFENWLKSLELSEDDIQYILNLATNGKLELELSAKKFIQNKEHSREV